MIKIYTTSDKKYEKSIIEKLKKENATLLVLPEFCSGNRMPSELSNYVLKKTMEHIVNDVDLTIFTYSEIVFYSVRTAIRNMNYSNSIVYYCENDKIIESCIDKSGRVEKWPKGYFDTIEQLLLKLI